MFSITIFICLILFLMFPSILSKYASNGLLLWYSQVIPVLFPFMLLTGLIVRSNIINFLQNRFNNSFIYPIFCIITGMLTGFPAGSVTVAKLYDDKLISTHHAKRLLCICNNASPGFIMSYVCVKVLQLPKISLIFFLIIHICTILSELLVNYIEGHFLKASDVYSSDAISSKTLNLIKPSVANIICSSLMAACKAITMAGACIVMCSIFYGFLQLLPINGYLNVLFAGLLEMTNGVSLCPLIITNNVLSAATACAITSFGGICALMQSIYAAEESITFPIKRYVVVKFISAVMCFIIIYLYLNFIL